VQNKFARLDNKIYLTLSNSQTGNDEALMNALIDSKTKLIV
jgi:hypothetical protein